MRVRALTFFFDPEIGARRAEGDEWETTDEHAAYLIERKLAQRVDDDSKRASGPTADKKSPGPGANKRHSSAMSLNELDAVIAQRGKHGRA